MKYLEIPGYPKAMVEALKAFDSDYDPGLSDFTPSSLSQSPYMRGLLKQYDDKIIIDPRQRTWALFGSAMHLLLERAKDNSIHELRIYQDIIGRDGKTYKIGMQMDHLMVEDGILTDYKATSVFKFLMDHNGTYKDAPDWETQLNIGAWILRSGAYYEKDGELRKFKPLKLKKIQILGFLKDWHRAEYERNKEGYPEWPQAMREFPIWDDEEVETHLRDRIEKHTQKDPDPCSSEDMWVRGDSYGVFRGNNKRATKSFKIKKIAEDFAESKGQEYKVVYRQGERIRCEHWCEASKFCPIFKSYKESSEKKKESEN